MHINSDIYIKDEYEIEVEEIINQFDELIKPLKAQIAELNERCDQKTKNVYDKQLKSWLAHEDISADKCVGEEYADLLEDFILFYDGSPQDLIDKMEIFIQESRNSP